MSGQIATIARIDDLIDEYNGKLLNLPNDIENVKAAIKTLQLNCMVQGQYVGSAFKETYIYESECKKNLLRSAWETMFKYLKIEILATSDDIKKIKKIFDHNPPEFNRQNVIELFGDYYLNTRFHILRGIAEVFIKLDNSYKSHSKVKIGVDGLPKRIIINGWYSPNYDLVHDVVNSLASYQNIPLMDRVELHDRVSYPNDDVIDLDKNIFNDDGSIKYPARGLSIKKFANNNIHIIFNKNSLLDINKALAEFYGDVLPDDYSETTTIVSTAVAKDLQFYPTPDKLIPYVFGEYNYKPETMVLEPSCGDGRIMQFAHYKKGVDKRNIHGIEFDRNRASQAREKGFNVHVANFLDTVPEEVYDVVLMNPPFYGKHYQKHIEHALKFLKVGGMLISILPATAKYDHEFAIAGYSFNWHDLPVASFKESGTNVPTVSLKIVKRR